MGPQLPLDFYHWAVAFAPIAILLVLMLAMRWGLAEAGPIGFFVVVVSGLTLFKAPMETIAVESIKGIWNAIFILYVVIPAIMIYEVLSEANAFEPFRVGFTKLSPHLLLQVLALGWVLASFFQAIAGFGTPIAVCAPLLVGLGVRPVAAVTIPLVAHAWGNTFAIGVAWNALKLVTNMPAEIVLPTAYLAAAFLWLLNFMGGIIVCWLFGRWEGVKEGFPAVVAISFVHGLLQMVLVPITTDYNTIVASIVAFAVVPLLAKTKWYSKPSQVKSSLMREGFDKLEVTDISEAGKKLSMVQASVPYLVLMVVMFSLAAFKPLKGFLSQWKAGFALPATTTGLGIQNAAETAYKAFAPLTHPGSLLFLSALIGFLYLSSRGLYQPGAFGRIFSRTLAKTMPSVIGVTALVAMSQVMNGTGQATILALGAAETTGPVFPFISPFIGVLGAFLTSSNMASNILFGNFQNLTAEVLSLNKVVILAAQTTGGAIGNTIAPGNVLLGTTTAGIIGKEGECLKTTIVVAIFCAAVTGIVALFMA